MAGMMAPLARQSAAQPLGRDTTTPWLGLAKVSGLNEVSVAGPGRDPLARVRPKPATGLSARGRQAAVLDRSEVPEGAMPNEATRHAGQDLAEGTC